MIRPPSRGPQPDPARRPPFGVTDLRTRLQSGYGSPEGAVYAGTGILWQDTDPEGSGAIWKKTTPDGNTGWVELGTGGGGGGGAWAELSGTGWVDGSGVGFAALANLDSIDDQSAGFALVDANTVSLPVGMYTVEWSFGFTFLLQNPWSSYMASSDFFDAWTVWRGGPAFVTHSVRSATVQGERHIDEVYFQDSGGGDGLFMAGQADPDDLFVWRGLIHAFSPNNLNLSLGILDFFKCFPDALDFAQQFTPFIQDPSLGSGDHFVRIGSVGS